MHYFCLFLVTVNIIIYIGKGITPFTWNNVNTRWKIIPMEIVSSFDSKCYAFHSLWRSYGNSYLVIILGKIFWISFLKMFIKPSFIQSIIILEWAWPLYRPTHGTILGWLKTKTGVTIFFPRRHTLGRRNRKPRASRWEHRKYWS